MMTPETILPQPVLRRLPPPQTLAHGLRLIPAAWQARILAGLMNRLVLTALPPDALRFLAERRLAIEVEDMNLRWVFTGEANRLRPLPAHTAAEATVRGRALDLLLLVSRLEDADTLFFHRRLTLTGDTALGLETRNLLDQLPWQQLSPGVRIGLNHLARFAQAARDARKLG